jgi:hypothetical protein
MRRANRGTWAVLLGLALMGCGGGEGAPPVADAVAPDSLALARARGAADGMGQDLLTMLMGALERGGPSAAIAFCADSAQARSARHAAEGITLRRVSERVRNPENRPDERERRLLAVMAANHAAGAGTEVTEMYTDDAGVRHLQYLRPIVVQERCVTCHGDPSGFPREVRALLAERYPADSATGYAPGDFRGAISVRVAVKP